MKNLCVFAPKHLFSSSFSARGLKKSVEHRVAQQPASHKEQFWFVSGQTDCPLSDAKVTIHLFYQKKKMADPVIIHT